MPIEVKFYPRGDSEPEAEKEVPEGGCYKIADDFSGGMHKKIIVDSITFSLGQETAAQVYAVDIDEPQQHGGYSRDVLRRSHIGSVGVQGSLVRMITDEDGKATNMVLSHTIAPTSDSP